MTGGLIAATTIALRFRDPHQAGSWGACPLRALTGLDCPFCGGLRATNDLTHGNLSAAAQSNLLFVASIPLIVALWGYWLWRWTRKTPPPPISGRLARNLAIGYAVVALAFTVFRNTPAGHFLWA